MMALLSVSAIALQRGCDRTTAWRYLRSLERRHGARLIREKRTLYIEPTELARVVALEKTSWERELRKADERIEALELAVKAWDVRFEELRKEVARLR